MGKGLQLRKEGQHVAFVGGTGALVFLDLISYIMLQNCGSLPGSSEPLSDQFKLHVYASFASRESAIGLEMMEQVHEAT